MHWPDMTEVVGSSPTVDYYKMPRGRPRSKKTGTGVKGRGHLKVIARKPIRPLERQKMRPWLLDLLDKGSNHQLAWYNKREKLFRISWKHAAGQTFDMLSDFTLFELWARHTGKFYNGDEPDPKKWKANFRCALHSLKDMKEVKTLGVKKGNNAFRVYRFLDHSVTKKQPLTKKRTRDERSSDEDEDAYNGAYPRAVTCTVTRSAPSKHCVKQELDSEGSEPAYSPSHDSRAEDWNMSDLEEVETPATDLSPLPHFEQLCGFSYDIQLKVTAEISDKPYVFEEENKDDLVIYMDPELNTKIYFDEDNLVSLQEEVIWNSESIAALRGNGPSVIVVEEQHTEYQSYAGEMEYL